MVKLSHYRTNRPPGATMGIPSCTHTAIRRRGKWGTASRNSTSAPRFRTGNLRGYPRRLAVTRKRRAAPGRPAGGCTSLFSSRSPFDLRRGIRLGLERLEQTVGNPGSSAVCLLVEVARAGRRAVRPLAGEVEPAAVDAPTCAVWMLHSMFRHDDRPPISTPCGSQPSRDYPRRFCAVSPEAPCLPPPRPGSE